MSLPSTVVYLDRNGEKVGNELVNCGWFCTSDSIVHVLTELNEIPENAHSVIVYGIQVPLHVIKFAKEKRGIHIEALTYIVDDCLRESNEKYKEELRKKIPETGDVCIVNSSGDLSIDREAGSYIGKQCIVVKVCKSGLIQIRERNGQDKKKTISLPRRNIDLRGYKIILQNHLLCSIIY